MEAIVLAGGFGTRLRSVVKDVPKPMAPIAGRPFLEILLETLARKGFTRVILSIGFMAENIMNHFGSHFSGIDIIYAVEKKPLGTGGAIRLGMSLSQNSHLYIFNGDTYLDIESQDIEALWKRNKRPVIVARHVPNTNRYGRLQTDGGRVTGYHEKSLGGSGLINAGCYLFNRGQLDEFDLNEPFSLETDYFARVLSKGLFDVFTTKGQFIDIGIPEDFLRAQVELGQCKNN